MWRFVYPIRAWGGTFDYRMLREELGWNQQKSDELLLPVIQRVNKRGAAAAANKQSNLETYFGDSIGNVGGSAIPRKRQPYTSKRLQKVVTDYREEQRERSRTTTKRGSSTILDSNRPGDQYMEGVDTDEDFPADFGEDLGSDDHEGRDPTSGSVPRTGNVSKSATTAATKRKGEKRKARKPSRSITTTRLAKRKKQTNDSDDYDDDEHGDVDEVTPVPALPRPKPVRKKVNTNPGAVFKTTGQEYDG